MSRVKHSYSFSVLRYVHDVVSGEFVNVGVILYSRDLRFIEARCTSNYSRVAEFFGGIDGRHFRSLMRHVEESTRELAQHYCSGLPIFAAPATIVELAKKLLPVDDSALQCSPRPGGGLTSSPALALERLYERYVELHLDRSDRTRRNDAQILTLFKGPLREKRVLDHLRTKRIESPLNEHEFPLAWKNGVWNVCEAISFDLLEGSSIREKAAQWAGRAMSLKSSELDFKIFMLIGKPSKPGLAEDLRKAEEILRQMPVDHEIYEEGQEGDFADLVADELSLHPQDSRA